MPLSGSEYNDWDIAAGGCLAQIHFGLLGRIIFAFHVVDNQVGPALADQLGSPTRPTGHKRLGSLAFQQHTKNFTRFACSVNNENSSLRCFREQPYTSMVAGNPGSFGGKNDSSPKRRIASGGQSIEIALPCVKGELVKTALYAQPRSRHNTHRNFTASPSRSRQGGPSARTDSH